MPQGGPLGHFPENRLGAEPRPQPRALLTRGHFPDQRLIRRLAGKSKMMLSISPVSALPSGCSMLRAAWRVVLQRRTFAHNVCRKVLCAGAVAEWLHLTAEALTVRSS